MNEEKVAWPGACPTKWKYGIIAKSDCNQTSYHVVSTKLSRDVNKPTFSGYTFFIINPIFELSLEWKFPKLLIIFEIEAHECLIFDHFRFISKENLTKFPIWGSRVAGQVFENLRWGVDNEVTYKKCVNLDAFMTFSVPDLGQCFWQPINQSAWPRILINVAQSLIGAYSPGTLAYWFFLFFV